MITERQVKDAAFWEETICPNCGAVGGEAQYACFECDKAVVLPAKQILFIIESVEMEEEDGND